MRYLQILVVTLVLGLVLGLAPGRTVADEHQQAAVLGGGAQFLPAETVFYLAVDLTPDSEQHRFLDRLFSIYLQAPEAQAAEQDLGRRLGLETSSDELLQRLRPALGGEIFLAVPSADDWLALSERGARRSGSESLEPDLLIGVAIRDPGVLLEVLAEQRTKVEEQGGEVTTEQIGGASVVHVAGASRDEALYLTLHRGYLLASTSRDQLGEAIGRDSSESLAAEASFRDARKHFASGPLAFLYTSASLPGDSLAFGGGLSEQPPTRWLAGALRLGEDLVTVEVAAATDLERIPPAGRALLAKPSNPLRSAGVVPADSTFYLGWDNVKLLWDQAVESTWPTPEAYTRFREETVEQVGLDPEEDVFGWMTGELAIFAALSHEARPELGPVALGLAIEAKDPALAGQKLTRILNIVEQLAAPGQPATTQELGGAPFRRISLGRSEAIYAGLVDGWVVLTSEADLAAETVAAVRGGPALAEQPEFQHLRASAGESPQVFGFLDLPELVRISTSEAAAVGGNPADREAVDRYLRPIRGVGLGVSTTADLVEATFLVHLVLPDAAPAQRPAPIPAPVQLPWP